MANHNGTCQDCHQTTYRCGRCHLRKHPGDFSPLGAVRAARWRPVAHYCRSCFRDYNRERRALVP